MSILSETEARREMAPLVTRAELQQINAEVAASVKIDGFDKMSPVEKLQAAREAVGAGVKTRVEQLEAERRFNTAAEAAKQRIKDEEWQARVDAEAKRQLAAEDP